MGIKWGRTSQAVMACEYGLLKSKWNKSGLRNSNEYAILDKYIFTIRSLRVCHYLKKRGFQESQGPGWTSGWETLANKERQNVEAFTIRCFFGAN